jgi:hypothetical protein
MGVTSPRTTTRARSEPDVSPPIALPLAHARSAAVVARSAGNARSGWQIEAGRPMLQDSATRIPR